MEMLLEEGTYLFVNGEGEGIGGNIVDAVPECALIGLMVYQCLGGCGSDPVIDAEHLRIIVSGGLEEVGGVEVAGDLNADLQFFHPFALEAVYGAFAPVEAAAGEFDDAFASYYFFVDEYFIVVYPQAVYSRVKAFLHDSKIGIMGELEYAF